MKSKPNEKDSIEMVSSKKTKNKVKSVAEEPEYESYSDISNAASATDCTGMMYAPPQSEGEFESYQDLYSMEIPKQKKEDKED